jgi:hypothetical protein
MEELVKDEIMTTEDFEVEDVIEENEEVEESGSGNGLKTVVGIGLVAGLSYLGYRFVVKPIKAKFKAKKEQAVEAEAVAVNDADAEVADGDSKGNVVGFKKKK